MKSQLCGCLSLENGVIVQDVKTKQFLYDAPDSDFTEHLEHAIVFPDFDAAVSAGRHFCGTNGFKVICFGSAVHSKPEDAIVDNVVFG